MGRKMKLPFLSHSKSLDPNILSSPTWPWPSCGEIKTLSFRATNVKDDAFRTYNSAFLDTQITPPDSFFTVSSSSRSFSTMTEEDPGDPVESVIRGLSSDRLFFEPEKSSSLVSFPLDPKNQLQKHEEEEEEGEEEEEKEEEDKEEGVAYEESVLLSMDSNNPYEDFRRSMEEMVEAHGLKDWQGLEELLRCYLKINGKNTHGYIVGAFIDLLVNSSFSNSTSTSTSTSTTITSSSSSSSCLSSNSNSNYSSPSSPLSLPSSSLTTPCLSSILDHGDDDDNDDDHDGNNNHDDGGNDNYSC